MMIQLHDVVILGLAVPEQHRDGRKTICVAAYHHDLGMIRLFPCHAMMGLSRWKKISLWVERNPKDNRRESFMPVSDLLKDIRIEGEVRREERIELLDKIKVNCVNDINTSRLSLGVIKPHAVHDVWIDSNPTFEKQIQRPLTLVGSEEWLKTKCDYPFQPKISYQCSPDCRGHEQTILEWGAFEWMRKNPRLANRVIDNWRLRDIGYEHYLIVGNQVLHRTSFLVINLVAFKTNVQTQSIKQSMLFDMAA